MFSSTCITLLARMVDHSRLVHLNFRRCSTIRLVANIATRSIHGAACHGVDGVVVQGEIIFTSIECSPGSWEDVVLMSVVGSEGRESLVPVDWRTGRLSLLSVHSSMIRLFLRFGDNLLCNLDPPAKQIGHQLGYKL